MPSTTLKQKLGLIFFGTLLTLVVLEVVLRLGGSILFQNQDLRNTASSGDDVYRILCVGESTTMIGGVNSYPRQLENILNKLSEGKRRYQVINKGVPGTDTFKIVSNIKNYLQEYNPDMVIAMMGVNDTMSTPFSSSNPGFSLQRFFQDFRVYKLSKLILQNLFVLLEGGNNSAEGSLSEEGLKKEIRKHPKSPWAYIALGEQYLDEDKFLAAEELFKKGLKRSLKKAWGYRHLGKTYILQKKFREAERLYKSAISKSSKKAWPYILLANFYEESGDIQASEKVLLEAFENTEGNIEIYYVLGKFYRSIGRYQKAIDILGEALDKKIMLALLYEELGYVYWENNSDEKHIEAFDLAVASGGIPKAIDLSQWYMNLGESKAAERMLISAVEEYPHDVRILRAISHFYIQDGQEVLAAKYEKRVVAIEEDKYFKATKYNYSSLVHEVLLSGASMVSVQYPLRNVDLLKKILDGQENIVFVDNKDVFEKAVENQEYSSIFTDNFAGDFGHCTKEGNRILAENIAKVLTEKQIFITH